MLILINVLIFVYYLALPKELSFTNTFKLYVTVILINESQNFYILRKYLPILIHILGLYNC